MLQVVLVFTASDDENLKILFWSWDFFSKGDRGVLVGSWLNWRGNCLGKCLVSEKAYI